IGSFYYTKEGYDNKNPNFGSTYPDYNGGVGILFEQGSSRGIRQQSENGIVTLGHTARNQLVAAIATIDAANGNRKELFDLQKEFFTVTGKSDKSSYIVGDEYDRGRVNKFLRLLLAHRLDVYENANDVTVGGVTYKKGTSYIIPVAQPNSALVQIIFDDKKDYPDVAKLGYGAGFSIAYSTGLSYAKLANPARGNKVEAVKAIETAAFRESKYAYLVDFRDSKSQQFLFRLLEKEVLVKAAFKSFSLDTGEGVRDFPAGTLLIPVSLQSIPSAELYALLKELGAKEEIEITPVATGYSAKGVDLGSSAFRTVNRPSVLVISGAGTSSTEVGEVWHLFDIKLRYPVVRVESANFSRIPLSDFNRIVLTNGAYASLDASALQSLREWIRRGNTLITTGLASQWAVSRLIETPSAGRAGRDSARVDEAIANPFAQRDRGGRVPTSVFETKIRLDHPIAFGLTSELLPVIRESVPSLQATGNPVSRYTEKPLLNGYIDETALARFKEAASIQVNSYGAGNIVLFGENPLFRGIWDATERTFINAVLFGDKAGGGIGRYF
ncbi:MAG: hypothetical protein LBQ39_03085, partial [Tannerellaceae bacterium]|nr:hypothetical protein [Tannerellaceae bacterium]